MDISPYVEMGGIYPRNSQNLSTLTTLILDEDKHILRLAFSNQKSKRYAQSRYV
jgi:hypothetical protein